jgi:catechol 2,3-dioxygenase-like lactoylglutathione lyase family enzyme
MPGTGSVRAGKEKPPPILPFTTHKESDQRPRLCWRDAPNADERFCRRIRPGDDVFGTHSRAKATDSVALPWRINVRERKEVGEVLALAAASGGKIIKPAQDVFWGGHSGYFADLDGHLWEVCWNPHFPLADDGTVLIP